MSSAKDRPLSPSDAENGPGPWTSSAALYRFVWAVKRDCMSQTALLAVPGRASLALWIGGLDLRDFTESGCIIGSPGDEVMLAVIF